jgi:hypothetical protein
MPKTTLIAGRLKPDQLLNEPFQTYYASLVRHAYQADAVLIGGYGFGDIHVNRAIKNSRTGPQGKRTMVLTLAPNFYPVVLHNDTVGDGPGNWLNTRSYWSGYHAPGFSTPVPNSLLIERQSFDVSGDGVAIWPGGFVEATARLNSITDWLDGRIDDAALGPH